ncbi:MAG: isoleucine--tRNA ligase [Halobacteriaceae archaeon]
MDKNVDSGLRSDRFAPVDEEYDPHEVPDKVFSYWDEVNAYEKTKDHRSDEEDLFFVDGPPYTSGSAHMGTTWNKALKDAYIRYYRMQGYNVTDRPGYDMHGLPIETKVEEKLGFETKQDIENFGMENFIEECKTFAEDQLEGLQEDFQSFGVWMDWDNPYKTLSPEYMEATWWAFNKVYERGLVEEGKRSVNQCPRCETAIADNEVEYHQIESPSIYVRFPLKNREGSLVIWTTTPWTIPANTFIAVDEELTYQAVRATKGDESEVLYIAEECVEEVLKKGRFEEYEVLKTFSGDELIGLEYEHPLAEEVPDHPDFEGANQVYHADYVEADRTGLVHSAPGHGEEDFQRGQELEFDIFCPVAGDGVYTEQAGKYAGTFVRDANDEIIDDLAANGYLLSSGTHQHRYGECWRCGTDIIFLATDQWFITVTDIKDELLENINDSEWYPDWARDNRFRNFVKESGDWNVSRQRYWGIPLPIWLCDNENCDHLNVISTREELADRVEQDIDPETVDLHRPTVDELTMSCAECGEQATRIDDVFDVWIDSSVASLGTLDFPKNQDKFERYWPADLIIEAHDQTRGWFWSQLGMGTAAFGEIPYKTVLMHGWANDENGRKMSKSVGNIVEPSEAIDRHGPDAMRLFLLSVTPQGEDMRFSWDEMANKARELNILWNVFRFPLPYMRMDDFDPTTLSLDEVSLTTIDRWVLSKLQKTKENATAYWDDFESHKALDEILTFVVEDVSRYYVQVVRERMWQEEESEEKSAAYLTLYNVLLDVTAMLAPYAPFITEVIYQNLTGEAGHPTVHMCDWPEANSKYREQQLEDEIAILRSIEESGSNARQQAGRKLRWPVPRVVVESDEDAVQEALSNHQELLAERLNAETIEVTHSWTELEYTAQADMSVLGPAFGDRANEVLNALNEARINEPSLDLLEEEVAAAVDEPIELTPEMVDFEKVTPENVYQSDFEQGSVFVDVSLNESIKSEGYAREIIRRAQEMRKDLDLDMEEEVNMEVAVFDEDVANLVSQKENLIKEEVRVADLTDVDDGYTKEWDIEGVTVTISISPIKEQPA